MIEFLLTISDFIEFQEFSISEAFVTLYSAFLANFAAWTINIYKKIYLLYWYIRNFLNTFTSLTFSITHQMNKAFQNQELNNVR